MPIKTGGQAIVDSLLAHSIHTIFGLPGIQNDWLFNALFDNRHQINVIHTRHEQGCAFMALGYALATGQPSAFSVVPGPGLLNATAALATAYTLNAKVLCLTGQIPSHLIGKDTGQLHEIPRQSDILRSLTKWHNIILHPSDAPRKIAQAFYAMRSTRPRPAAIEAPPDILKLPAQVPHDSPVFPPFYPPVDSGAVQSAGKILGQAKHPIIFVGSGAQNASPLVTQLAELLEAPVVAHRTGHGILDSRHYLSLKLPEAHPYYKKTDAALAIGTHMRIPLTRWGTDSHMTTIRIDVDNDAITRIQRPDIPIIARAEDALPPLINAIDQHNRKRESRHFEMQSLKAQWAKSSAFLQPQIAYLNILRDELDQDGIFVSELTQIGYAARSLFPVYKPRAYISSGYQGTLGFGFPTALGAKVARPNLQVLSITGDGGFMFSAQELATALQHRIPVVTVLFNNNAYGNVRTMQIRDYDERVIATDLLNPDFVKMAESFGANAFLADTHDKLRKALRYGFSSDLPTLIEVPIGHTPSIDHLRDQGQIRFP